MTKEDILNELFIRQEISLAQYLQLLNSHRIKELKELKELYNQLIDNQN